jgi:hypothetical protein
LFGSFLPGLLVGLHHQSLPGSREPTLSWNQLHQQPGSERRCLLTVMWFWSGRGQSCNSLWRSAKPTLNEFSACVAPEAYLGFNNHGDRMPILMSRFKVPPTNCPHRLLVRSLVKATNQLNTANVSFVADYRL